MNGLDISYFQDEHNEDVKHTHLVLSLRFDKHIDKNTALKYAMNNIKALLDIKETIKKKNREMIKKMPLHFDYSETEFSAKATDNERAELLTGGLFSPLNAICLFLYKSKIGSYADRGEHMLMEKDTTLEKEDIDKLLKSGFLITNDEERLREVLNMLIGLKVWSSI